MHVVKTSIITNRKSVTVYIEHMKRSQCLGMALVSPDKYIGDLGRYHKIYNRALAMALD